MTISNYQLVEIAKKNNIQLYLKYIIYRDELKNIPLQKHMNIIINFSTTGHTGTHFTALLIRNNNALYFDSFGCVPLPEVTQYCKLHKLKLGYNNYIIQNIASSNCGIYCLALILYIGQSKNLYDKANDYINMYEDDTKENDHILLTYLKHNGIKI